MGGSWDIRLLMRFMMRKMKTFATFIANIAYFQKSMISTEVKLRFLTESRLLSDTSQVLNFYQIRKKVNCIQFLLGLVRWDNRTEDRQVKSIIEEEKQWPLLLFSSKVSYFFFIYIKNDGPVRSLYQVFSFYLLYLSGLRN